MNTYREDKKKRKERTNLGEFQGKTTIKKRKVGEKFIGGIFVRKEINN